MWSLFLIANQNVSTDGWIRKKSGHVTYALQDIAVLNQMFSTAVLHQAEAIESIYEAAVDASQVNLPY